MDISLVASEKMVQVRYWRLVKLVHVNLYRTSSSLSQKSQSKSCSAKQPWFDGSKAKRFGTATGFLCGSGTGSRRRSEDPPGAAPSSHRGSEHLVYSQETRRWTG